MKTIGLSGGSSLSELGPASDVQLFFDCVEEFVVYKLPEQDWNILTDRLYRRYIRIDELAKAAEMMEQVKQVFANLSSSAVDWGGITGASAKTRLDPSRSTLAEVFAKYFENFAYCKESAEFFFKSWKIYQPVRIVVSDMPEFMKEKNRQLDDYEKLEGPPFWL
jgi:hypothetical protein